MLQASGVVVGVWSLLRGPLIFRDVAQVDADAIPDGGASAHAVDKDVVRREVGGGLEVRLLPASESGFGGGAIGRVGDGEQRGFGGAFPGGLRGW